MGIQFEQSKTLFIMFADTSTPKAESPLRQESHLMCTSRRRTEMTCKKSTLSLAAWGFLAAHIHNPSVLIDPDYWRVYLSPPPLRPFAPVVGLLHPRKAQVVARFFLLVGTGARLAQGSPPAAPR